MGRRRVDGAAARRAWLGALVAAYVSALADEGIPLSDRLMVAAILSDLCRLAGADAPAAVEAALAGERWERA